MRKFTSFNPLRRAFIVCLLLSTALISAYALQGPPPAPMHPGPGPKPHHHLTSTKDSLTPRDTTHWGDVTIDLPHNSDSIRLDSDFTCTGKLHLKKGVLNLNHHKLTLHGGCQADSGTLKTDSLSSIEIIGNDSTIRLHFGHGHQHLGKLKVHDCDTTVIDGDVVVTDSTELVGGILDISAASFDPQGPLTILNTLLAGNGQSSFFYHGNATRPDTLRFVGAKDSLGILKIDHSKFPLVLGTNVRICDSLCLDSAKIFIHKGILNIGKKCILKGFDRTNYVITGDSGALQRTVPANGKALEFPIGTLKHYAPATITQTKGADTSEYRVTVAYGVLTNGLTGDSLTTKPVIKNTWHVTCTSTSFALNLKLKAPKELAELGFNPKKCYISHYEKHRWDSVPPITADTTDASVTLTRTGITTLSPFTIMSARIATSLSATQENNVLVYPNPATNFVTFSAAKTGSKVAIIDLTGRVQRNLTLSGDNSTVDVTDLPAGLYLYKIYSDGKVAATGKLAVSK